MAFYSDFWHSVSTSCLPVLVTIIFPNIEESVFALGIFKEGLKVLIFFFHNLFFLKLQSALFEETFEGISRGK